VYCDDPKQFVPLRQSWALFDAAAQLEDEFLGWHVGRFFGDSGITRTLLRRIEGAPTLYRALQDFERLVSSEASHLEIRVVERPSEIRFCSQYSTIKDWPGYASSQSYQLEAYVDLIRHYAGPDWAPREIGIEHPTVPAIAREHFPNTRILPHQPMGYVTVPRSCLHLPPRCGAAGESNQRALVMAGELDYVTTLRTLLEPHLLEGYPSRSLAASLMGISVRTLSRRLAESGVSYRNLIDDVRLRVAKKHLENSDLRIIDVAGAVGFSDPANFSRMFCRLAGISPRHFRRMALVVRGTEDAPRSAALG
jgi:AraC-like DNA-binding protein